MQTERCLLFALIVCFSRVYFGLHYFSDVIFGGILGVLVGILVLKLEDKFKLSKKVTFKIFGRWAFEMQKKKSL